MNALAIIGCCLGGTMTGALVGLTQTRGADDLGIAAGMNMMGGAFVGGFLGVCVGAVVFA